MAEEEGEVTCKRSGGGKRCDGSRKSDRSSCSSDGRLKYVNLRQSDDSSRRKDGNNGKMDCSTRSESDCNSRRNDGRRRRGAGSRRSDRSSRRSDGSGWRSDNYNRKKVVAVEGMV